MTAAAIPEVVTVTLNPAIDRTAAIARFAAGAVNRAEQVDDQPGGKGINVAAALVVHGHTVAALGFLGRDNAELFEAFFSARGIEDRCIRLPGATRVGIKIVDPASGRTTDINFPGLAPAAADMAELRSRIETLETRWCVLAGSLPPGVEPGVYRGFVTALKARGVRVVVDSSGPALREALRAAPDIIKPNVHELEELLGKTLPTEDVVIAAARTLVAGGVGMVIVSRGAEGACFVTAGEVVTAVPPAVEVHSTVGAGDATVAGMVAAQLRGLSLAESARLATAFSLAVLTRTEPGPAAQSAVEPFLGRVRIALV